MRNAFVVGLAALVAIGLVAAVIRFNRVATDQEVREWVSDRALALPLPGEPSNFEFLSAMIGTGRIVGVGESTHGTHEFQEVRLQILKFLVEELGFKAVAIEGSFAASAALNQYVIEGEGSLDKALTQLAYWTMRTEETRQAIEWVRRHNQTVDNARKVLIFGVDGPGADLGAEVIVSYLRRVSPSFASEATVVLSELYKGIGSAKQSDTLDLASVELVSELIEILDGEKAEFIGESSVVEFDVVRRTAVVLGELLRVLSLPDDQVSDTRELFLASNTKWILEHCGPGSRIVVWAHNGHISSSQNNQGSRSMGAYIQDSIGDDYIAIGQLFGRGSFRAFDSASREIPVFTAEPPAGTLEDLLLSARSSSFAVDLRSAPLPVARWLKQKRRMVHIGPAYNAGGAERTRMFEQFAPPFELFDVIVFSSPTSPTSPIRPVLD